jgi:hypothetical protein
MRNVFPYKAKLYHLHIACQMDTDSLISRSSAGFFSLQLCHVLTSRDLVWERFFTNFFGSKVFLHMGATCWMLFWTQKKNLHSFLFYITYKRI